MRGASRLLVLHRTTGASGTGPSHGSPTICRPGTSSSSTTPGCSPRGCSAGDCLAAAPSNACYCVNSQLRHSKLPRGLNPRRPVLWELDGRVLGIHPVGCPDAPGTEIEAGLSGLFEGTSGGARRDRCDAFSRAADYSFVGGPGLDVAEAIERIGHVPLPPYINAADRAGGRDRYQTVYARERDRSRRRRPVCTSPPDARGARPRGVERTEVTLHVGYGTFRPNRADRVESTSSIPSDSSRAAAANAITRARREGRRVVAVGTTTADARILARTTDGSRRPPARRLFIRPGHEFRVVDALSRTSTCRGRRCWSWSRRSPAAS